MKEGGGYLGRMEDTNKEQGKRLLSPPTSKSTTVFIKKQILMHINDNVFTDCFMYFLLITEYRLKM